MKRDFTFVPPVVAGVRPSPRSIPAGGALFRRGDKTFGIFHLEAGRLRMQRVTPDGGTVVMHMARAGEMFAEASLFADCYQCDVIAEIDSVVWVYSKEDLTQRLRADPQTLWAFCATLARGLHGLRQRYELKQIRSAPERVLQLLRIHCSADGVFQPSGSLKDLAAELGLTHEALYRALAALEKAGRITRFGNALRLVS
jgi:CRP-like cAMP-binding protein